MSTATKEKVVLKVKDKLRKKRKQRAINADRQGAEIIKYSDWESGLKFHAYTSNGHGYLGTSKKRSEYKATVMFNKHEVERQPDFATQMIQKTHRFTHVWWYEE